jgi:hypothetical protein
MKNAGYFISTGDKNGFYTLRKMEIESSVDSDGMPYSNEKEIYFQNLSTDRAEALAKAKEITGYDLEVGFDLTTIARLKEEEYARLRALRAEYLANFDASVFGGGKYAGRKIAEILVEDEQYVRWFSNSSSNNDEIQLQVATCKALLAPAIAAEQASRDGSRQKLIGILGEAWLRSFINTQSEGFCHSVACQILGIRFSHQAIGNPVEVNVAEDCTLPSDRALDIMLEIKAKNAGRKGSKAYKTALEALESAITA